MSTCVEDVVEYFIYLSSKDQKGISNKKLQKLVYYAQAWSLAFTEKPLFPEKFEAWIHGPAVPSLYRKFKKFGFKPVESQNLNFNPQSLSHTNILDEVWRVYGKYAMRMSLLLTSRSLISIIIAIFVR
jgi:uncharacterized phage-associated protein